MPYQGYIHNVQQQSLLPSQYPPQQILVQQQTETSGRVSSSQQMTQ